MAEKIDGMSLDIESLNKEKLQAIFPECFTEGRLEIDKLLALCGEYINDDFEKYEFKWKGKSECLRLAQKRSTATLRPVPEDSVNWKDTKNLYIEGDNLEVLKLLQKSYFRKVKMIYIDPPYNTGNDFVYQDSFADPLARYKEVTQQTTKSNPETMGRYHTNWLNMMYPRLRLAANLLRDDGIIFISIDDLELENLKKMCNEVFGEENFIKCLVWKNRYGGGAKEKFVVSVHEYILIYSKNVDSIGELYVPLNDERISKFYTGKDEKYEVRGPFRTQPLEAARTLGERPNLVYAIPAPDGTEIWPKRQWLWSKERVLSALKDGELLLTQNGSEWSVRIKQYLKSSTGEKRQGKLFSILDGFYTQQGSQELTEFLGNPQIFSYPKPKSLIKELLNLGSKENSVILDFFSGSATTAHAVMQLNAEDGGSRQYICVQLPEICDEKGEAYKAGYKNICEIGKERIRRAGKKILESGDGAKPLPDIGFKVFRLDSSNMRLWDDALIEGAHLETLFARMDHAIDNLKPDRNETDLVYEILLKMGSSLTAELVVLDISGLIVYSVDNQSMLICLQPGITAAHIEQMAAYAPKKIVLAENALADNSTMSNAHYLLQNNDIELKIV